MAVLPKSRGKGASALINKKPKEIDKARLPCFLRTQDKENVAIYQKFAFHHLKEDPVSSDISHYTMLRPWKQLRACFSCDKSGGVAGVSPAEGEAEDALSKPKICNGGCSVGSATKLPRIPLSIH